jgi:flagellin-specific chaperone FliS
MNAGEAYRQHQTTGLTRIDMLLALFDAIVDRLERALAGMRQGSDREPRRLLTSAQVLLGGLAAGVVPGSGEIATNLLRLYEFVSRKLRAGTADDMDAALSILRILREAFLAIRAEALDLERRGVVPRANQVSSLQLTA